MKKVCGFSAVVIPEDGVYSCWCPELDIASWGKTPEKGLKNLKDAVKLHLSCLPQSELKEVKQKQHTNLVTTIEVPVPA